MRSSKGYWQKRCNELKNMVRQIGNPTIFFTLSAADYYWPDLFNLLCPNKKYEELSEKEKRQLMHDNPIVTAYFFQQRVKLFIKHVLVPLFGVIDYWYRFEWQNRGSPHVHGVLWLQNEPTFDYENITPEDVEKLINYFDKLCYVVNPQMDSSSDTHPSRKTFSSVIIRL